MVTVGHSWSLFHLLFLCIPGIVSSQAIAQPYLPSGDCEAGWVEWSSWSAPCGEVYRSRTRIINPPLPPCDPRLMVETKKLADCPACNAEDKEALPLVAPVTLQVLGEVGLHWYGSGHGQGQLSLDLTSHDDWKLMSVTSYVGTQDIPVGYYDDVAGGGVLSVSPLSTSSHTMVYELNSIVSDCFEPVYLNVAVHANLSSPRNSSVYVQLSMAGSQLVQFKTACYCGDSPSPPIKLPPTGGPAPTPEAPRPQQLPPLVSPSLPLEWACLAGVLATIFIVVGCLIVCCLFQRNLSAISHRGGEQYSKQPTDDQPHSILSPFYLSPSHAIHNEESPCNFDNMGSGVSELRHYVTQVTSPSCDSITCLSV